MNNKGHTSILKPQSFDETSSWDEIRRALSVFKIDLEPMQGAGSQRLAYEDFERIFYHMFLLIDGPGTRRKFRLIYPASDREKRDQFIESSITFINQRRLNPQPISRSHLRAFGGETFRKLLSTIIRQVKDVEVKQIKKYLTSFQNESQLMSQEISGLSSPDMHLVDKVERKLKVIDENIEYTKRYFERR